MIDLLVRHAGIVDNAVFLSVSPVWIDPRL